MKSRSIGLFSAASLTLCGSNTLAGEPLPYAEALGYATAPLPLPEGADPIREFWSVRLFRDVNHDGVDDLILAESSDSSQGFDVWAGYALGTQNGQFETPVGIDVDEIQHGRPDILAVGVVDLSGNIGFFVSSDDQLVMVQIIDGIQTVIWTEDTPRIRDLKFDWPVMETGDLDGDGLDEVLFLTSDWEDEVVIRWTSETTADQYQRLRTGVQEAQIAPVRDYNADGLPDLLVMSSRLDQASLFTGNSDGTLSPSTNVLYSSGSIGVAPCFGSFDSDPSLDILSINENTGEAVFTLNFTTAHAQGRTVEFPGLVDGYLGTIDCVGDLNGDGLDEIAIYLGPGKEFDGYSWALWSGGPSLNPTLERIFTYEGVDARRRVIDANQDGLPDLGIFSGGVRVALARANPDGRPSFGSTPVAPGTKAFHALPVDLEGDGTVGIVFTGGVEGYAEDPTTLSPAALLDVSGPSFMSVSPDLDADGNPELVITSGEGFEVFPVLPDGSLGVPVFYDIDPIRDDRVYGLAFADLDGDGRDDVVASTQGLVRAYRSTGETELIEVGLIGAGIGMLRPVIADANGDGHLDLFVSRSQDVRLFLGDGEGGFLTEFTQIELNSSHWFEVTDLDGDGYLDIIGVRGIGISIFHYEPKVVFGMEGGGFGPPLALPASGKFVEIATADIDGNGLQDILLADGQIFFVADDLGVNENSGVVLQTAPRVFQPMVALPQQEGAGIAVADFNNDGGMDVVTVGTAAVGALIHWGEPAPCKIDYFPDGVLNFFDLGEFLGLFSSQRPAADLAAPEGIWNFFDLAEFLTLFGQGCP